MIDNNVELILTVIRQNKNLLLGELDINFKYYLDLKTGIKNVLSILNAVSYRIWILKYLKHNLPYIKITHVGM